MDYSLKTLEFNQIQNNILKYCYTEHAKGIITNLIPNTNIDTVNQNLNMTNETLKIIAKFGKIPFMEDFDNIILSNKELIERVYSVLEILHLKLYLSMESNIRTYFKQTDKQIYINELTNLYDHGFILTTFNKVISDYGEIYDDATFELKQIRSKIKKLNFDLEQKMNKLLKTYESYLTDNIITTRNGRYCLAVKESYKNKITGVTHDISQSGQTFFIEPELSLQISAEIEMNKILEQKEITKILINLTKLINDNILTLKENFNKLLLLDSISAKSLYSLEIDGIKPLVNNTGNINLVNAKHPLIDKKVVVPISLSINKNNHTLLITGPNTGGKTVTLKTIGLLTVMTQTGILIPVSAETEIAIFDNIFVDIGDEQSIANSLSTFSSHMAKIVRYIDNLTDNTLILLDELGSGTDPQEGVSLAIAILEEFQKKDTRIVITSHFSELKTYAYEKDDIKTASVAFDKDTLKPLYYIEHGISGQSHARLIAKRLGMKLDVIEKANQVFSNKETNLNKIFNRLSEEKEEFNKRSLILEEELKKAKEQQEEYEKTKNKLLSEQNNVIQKLIKDQEKVFLEKLLEIDILIDEIKKDSSKEHLVAKLKGTINEDKNIKSVYDKSLKIAKGDKVFIKPYGQYGEVVSVKANKYRVVFGHFDLEFLLSDLELVKNEVIKKEVRKVSSKKDKPNLITDTSKLLKLDLRGFRYEEVAEEMDKAIDQAILNNIGSLTIIHGFGTGAVKNAVYEYIKHSKHIKSKRYGGEGEGLNGATIITLK